jgi:hypothetical protein
VPDCPFSRPPVPPRHALLHCYSKARAGARSPCVRVVDAWSHLQENHFKRHVGESSHGLHGGVQGADGEADVGAASSECLGLVQAGGRAAADALAVAEGCARTRRRTLLRPRRKSSQQPPWRPGGGRRRRSCACWRQHMACEASSSGPCCAERDCMRSNWSSGNSPPWAHSPRRAPPGPRAPSGARWLKCRSG